MDDISINLLFPVFGEYNLAVYLGGELLSGQEHIFEKGGTGRKCIFSCPLITDLRSSC